MILAVDEILPWGQEAFSPLGEIRPFSGRKISPVDVKDADALIVRSVTRVDAALLEGSSVKFVGTATIGMDHLDEPYLRARGIRFTNAAGSNSNSVAEYITAALLVMADRRGWDLRRKSLGIVGVGHVGSKVEKKARALGMEVLLCDPPLRETTGDRRYGFLGDVLGADILTLHVPLTRDGRYPTYHMVDRDVLQQLSPHQFLINSARGSVVEGNDLKRALAGQALDGAILDVWEGEPRIDYSLLEHVEIGTPHIAGYSLDGKVAGTAMVLEELCGYFGIPHRWDTGFIFPPPRRIRPASGTSGQDALRSTVLQAYDLLRDDANLRAFSLLPADEARAGFDGLRNNYDFRPEFRHCVVQVAAGHEETAGTLKELGFKVEVSN